MSSNAIGLFAGLLLGVAFAAGGFSGFLIALVLGILGVLAVRVIEGDVDINQYFQNVSQKKDQ